MYKHLNNFLNHSHNITKKFLQLPLTRKLHKPLKKLIMKLSSQLIETSKSLIMVFVRFATNFGSVNLKNLTFLQLLLKH